MAAPPFDINAPDPGAGQWGPEITATRDNITNTMLWAAGTGQRIPDWDSNFVYGGGGGELTVVTMTYQTDNSIKMKWTYTYSGGRLDTELWQYDLGSGFETPIGGLLTYVYSGGQLIDITSS